MESAKAVSTKSLHYRWMQEMEKTGTESRHSGSLRWTDCYHRCRLQASSWMDSNHLQFHAQASLRPAHRTCKHIRPTVSEKNCSSEFVKSLVASGAGAAGAGLPLCATVPILCLQKPGSKSDRFAREQISGDDVFLLLQYQKRKGTIRFLKSEKAMVTTAVLPT